MKLTKLNCGEFGIINKIVGLNKTRLSELGFNPGTLIKMICCGCYGGPLKINCRSSDYALRRDEAENIDVDKITHKTESISDNKYWWYKDF